MDTPISAFCTEFWCESFLDDGVFQFLLKILPVRKIWPVRAGSVRTGSAVRAGSVRAGSRFVSVCAGSVRAGSVLAVLVRFVATLLLYKKRSPVADVVRYQRAAACSSLNACVNQTSF